MLDQARGFWSQDLAVDLGSSNTRVWVRGRGLVLDQPTVVAIDRSGNGTRVVSVGLDAKEMVGRTPGHITAARPIRRGIIDDFELAEALLGALLSEALGSRPRVRTRLLVCIPADLSAVQKRAVQESARAAGANEVHLVHGLMAAAVGAHLPVHEPTAHLLVDIGGGTTDIGVISLGGLVGATSLPLGGEDLDKELIESLKLSHGILVGERTAEELKLELGRHALEQGMPLKVKGRDLQTGIPREISLDPREAGGALQPAVEKISQGIQAVLAKTTPEVSADILEHGIVLTGGSSQLPGLDRLLSQLTGLPAVVTERPSYTTIEGAGMLLSDDRSLARLSI